MVVMNCIYKQPTQQLVTQASKQETIQQRHGIIGSGNKLHALITTFPADCHKKICHLIA
jgi:hypothetical protein